MTLSIKCASMSTAMIPISFAPEPSVIFAYFLQPGRVIVIGDPCTVSATVSPGLFNCDEGMFELTWCNNT